MGLRVLHGGAWGYSYTENLSEAALTRCFDDALENASLVAPEGFAALTAPATHRIHARHRELVFIRGSLVAATVNSRRTL